MKTMETKSAQEIALAAADQSERRAKQFVLLGGVIESAVFIAILVAIDWGDRTHLVVFLCACLVYAPLTMGLYALRHHIDLATQRVLLGVPD